MSEASIWPPIIWIAIVAMGVGSNLVKDGEQRTSKHSFIGDVVGTVLIGLLLWWGGFFAPLFGGAR